MQEGGKGIAVMMSWVAGYTGRGWKGRRDTSGTAQTLVEATGHD